MIGLEIKREGSFKNLNHQDFDDYRKPTTFIHIFVGYSIHFIDIYATE